jgi:hypothetical protein
LLPDPILFGNRVLTGKTIDANITVTMRIYRYGVAIILPLKSIIGLRVAANNFISTNSTINGA